MQQKKIMKNLTINCNDIQISNDKQICLIAGPCQLETEQHALDMAGKIGEIAKKYTNQLILMKDIDIDTRLINICKINLSPMV